LREIYSKYKSNTKELQNHNLIEEMGKKDFQIFIQQAQAYNGGIVPMKISYFSDLFDPQKNFAGLIVYHVDGQFEWQQDSSGKTAGFKGRSFYIVIQDTGKWPETQFKRAGQGMIHDHILKSNIGITKDSNRVCCAGFAVMNGVTKYSSIWLNKTENASSPMPWYSDGDKMMSSLESQILDFAVSEWKNRGKNITFGVRLQNNVLLTFRIKKSDNGRLVEDENA
jgi:hypothetical protein